MRKLSIIYGMIGLALVCSVGLLNLSPGVAQLGLGTQAELIASGQILKDVAIAPEQYLGQIVTVEGYALHLEDMSDIQWPIGAGEFFLTISLERPVKDGIWVVFSENAEVVPRHVPSFAT